MISNRTGKDPVIQFLDPLSDPSPAGCSWQAAPKANRTRRTATTPASTAAPSLRVASTSRQLRSAASAILLRVRSVAAGLARPVAHTLSQQLTPRRRAVAAALLAGGATVAATLTVAVANHYPTPQSPLAAPPIRLTHVPNATQALASASVNRKHNRFVEALHLNRLTGELADLHPIRTIERPLVALGNPLRGIATWYGDVLQGHKTASGETFDDTKLTAAHKTLPLGTVVRVTDLRSQRSVVVRINDRGILAPGRIIDLSSAAAEQLGILRAGVANVKLEVLEKPSQS